MMPTNVAARMTLAADPGSLHGAVAAGILGAGPVLLGTSEECAVLLTAAQERVAAGEEPEAVAADIAGSIRAARGKLPGFGHPVHKPLDPRAERILELAEAPRRGRPARPARRSASATPSPRPGASR